MCHNEPKRQTPEGHGESDVIAPRTIMFQQDEYFETVSNNTSSYMFLSVNRLVILCLRYTYPVVSAFDD